MSQKSYPCTVRALWALALALAVSLTQPGFAYEDSETVGAESSFALAGGASFGFARRLDFGEGASDRFFIEPLVHAYFPTPLSQLFVRASLHGSYMWDQNEMPQALRVVENDAYIGFQMGLVFDWILVPAFSIGGQYIHRTVDLVVSEPISAQSDRVSGSENIFAFLIQAGLGFPISDGLFVIETFLRQRFIPEDSREGVTYGLELTVQVL
jgi:hypothetical protein